eukprot:98566-Chlamydomonas_euryale.AAC.3
MRHGVRAASASRSEVSKGLCESRESTAMPATLSPGLHARPAHVNPTSITARLTVDATASAEKHEAITDHGEGVSGPCRRDVPRHHGILPEDGLRADGDTIRENATDKTATSPPQINTEPSIMIHEPNAAAFTAPCRLGSSSVKPLACTG